MLKKKLIKSIIKNFIAFFIIFNFQLLLICYHFFVHETTVNNLAYIEYYEMGPLKLES